jgi:uncharacterized FlgJ-related protein
MLESTTHRVIYRDELSQVEVCDRSVYLTALLSEDTYGTTSVDRREKNLFSIRRFDKSYRIELERPGV